MYGARYKIKYMVKDIAKTKWCT